MDIEQEGGGKVKTEDIINRLGSIGQMELDFVKINPIYVCVCVFKCVCVTLPHCSRFMVRSFFSML